MTDIIPFHRPYPWSKADREYILYNIENELISGQLTNGKHVQQLEDEIQEFYNVKYCIATSNATMGLYFSWKFYGDFLGPIHMPNFTWPSFYYLLDPNVYTEFHDINPKTWLMENDYGGGVVMPVHTFGNITEAPRKHKNKIIYDGSHSLGCIIKDIGDATVFSLAATKIITSCEGGLVITNNKELAKYVRDKRDKCCRMSEPHAIIGLQTLHYLLDVMKWKREVFDYYSSKIPGQFQEVPIESNYNTIAFRNIEHLIMSDTFETKQYYEPIKLDILPNAYKLFKEIVVLPSYFNCDYKKIVEDILELNKI